MSYLTTYILLGCLLGIVPVISSPEEAPYKVYRITPETNEQLQTLSWLRHIAVDYDLDIWKDTSGIGSFMDIMVPPGVAPHIERFLSHEHISYTITITDVKNLIEKNEVNPEYRVNKTIQKSKNRSITIWDALLRRSKDDPILDEKADTSESSLKKIGKMKAKYRFGDYSSYKDMIKYMRTIAYHYPHITKLIRLGNTHSGTPIEGLKIGHPINVTNKRSFWIDGNIHAREWASSHTALYFINQLVSGYGKDVAITRYVNILNIYIFPCLNPDGYEYTRSQPFVQVRLWRKNRSPQKCVRSLWGGRRCCEGVDLNRNFDFHWGGNDD